MLKLVKSGEFIRYVPEGTALYLQEDEIYTSPAAAGWALGDYALVDAATDEMPTDPTPEDIKARLASYAARKRFSVEVGGAVWNGWPVHTDRDSQSKIIAERLAIEAGERADPDGWKFADGIFRLVSNDDFVALASAVRAHVRNCFAIEAAVLDQIEAGLITTEAQIDDAIAGGI